MEINEPPYYFRVTGYLFSQDLDGLMATYADNPAKLNTKHIGRFDLPIHESPGERIIPFHPAGKSVYDYAHHVVAAAALFTAKGYAVKRVDIDLETGSLRTRHPSLTALRTDLKKLNDFIFD